MANYSYSYERQKEDEEKVKKTVSALISNNGTVVNLEAVNNILGILFPRTKTAVRISYSIGRDYAHRDFLINNKIAVSECFDRYFALVLENDAISTPMIKRLIYDSNETDFSEGIMQLYQKGKIIRLPEEIEAYANRGNLTVISEERASLIIKNLARNWSSFEVDDRGFFSVPFEWRLLFCVDPLLKTMDSASRLSCIYAVFEDKFETKK